MQHFRTPFSSHSLRRNLVAVGVGLSLLLNIIATMAGPAGAQDTGKKIRYVYVDLGAPAFGVAVVAAMKVVVLTHFGHIDEAGGLASPGNTVSILHLGTLSLKNTVTVGLAPVSVAVNHNCNPPIAFVSNFGDNSVSVIRWDNPPNPAPSGLVGAGPQGVAVDPNPIDFLAYPCGIGVVANSLEQTLTVVDLSPSGPPSGPVAIGTVLHVRYPSGVAIHPRTHLALATDGFSPGKVIMIDITVPSAPKVGSRIPVGHTPSCIAIDQSRNLALVTNRGDHTLSVISLSPHADRGNTQPAKEIVRLPVGQEPFGVAIDEGRGIGVVVNRQDKSLSLIRLDPPYSPSVLRTIPLKCIDCFPSGVAIVPESDVPGSHGSLRALVTDLRSDMLTVVDIPESMLYRQ